eukprot:CAMPEP_0183296762 /NCGR_PEP_ID=MMETSP0160_2-20130417/4201_1 /TAXON_ID=2839 ORGANISM="Odontella Sinensis, Strain Grunow 1884" /NCGR_SAMPLE_ID=MMETSP0160_2 /ASSEMBLY_ACC=CAM_ASM_000250 /LENGTH=221 /DNA_ID=CAMNT_0025458429 /DNA_START=11 /DNA_END=676 /DNA_ORIENTATION=-
MTRPSAAAAIFLLLLPQAAAFAPAVPPSGAAFVRRPAADRGMCDRAAAAAAAVAAASVRPLRMSDWSDFAYDDPDEDDPLASDDFIPADENDTQEYKAVVGSSLESPEIDWDGEPLFVPQGSVLPLTEDNVQAVLAACRQEIGTMFGYSAENRGVGITGGVDFVELDGPTVVLHIKGRFWHQRTTVLDRVGAYIIGRIPEVIDVTVADEWELTDEANDMAL